MPLISIIVPVYKVETFLYACIDSILAQTFSDFELILVDDGSPDNSGSICDAYAEQDSRILVIHQKNQGQSAARNHGVAKARGTWICFVDSDDVIHPQLLEHLYHAAICSNTRISMCDHVERETLPQGFEQHCENCFSVMTMEEDTWISLYDADRYPCWVIWEKLIHRDIILKYPFQEGRIYEDNAVVCYWFWEAGSVAYLPQKLYFYRVNPTGTTKGSFQMKKLDYLWALEEIIRFCQLAELHELRERFCTRYLQMAYNFRYQIEDMPDRKEITRKIRKNVKHFLNAEQILMTKEQHRLVLDLYCPFLADIRERINVVVRIIREKGLREFVCKVIAFLNRGR